MFRILKWNLYWHYWSWYTFIYDTITISVENKSYFCQTLSKLFRSYFFDIIVSSAASIVDVYHCSWSSKCGHWWDLLVTLSLKQLKKKITFLKHVVCIQKFRARCARALKKKLLFVLFFFFFLKMVCCRFQS